MKLPLIYQQLVVLLLLALVTFLNYQFATHLGLAGVVSTYLVLVVLTTYYFRFPLGLLMAGCAFLIINFFFVDPVYTWQIAELASWAALVGFLLVSIVISSLVGKLRHESEVADEARKRAEFSKRIAEEIAAATGIDGLFSTSSKLIHTTFDKPVAIAQLQENEYLVSHKAGDMRAMVSQSAILWAANSGRMAGPGTDNWPELSHWIIPLERLPGKSPVLLIGNAEPENANLADDFRALADQLFTAYQRLCNLERARQAELLAHEESIHNTLLASISHDMRTPLTGIIGAAGTLLGQLNTKTKPETKTLLESILSEAEQLAAATENILSLVQLESIQSESIALDWQSPEEIVGILMTRYRSRGMEHRIKPEVIDNTTLIKGHATLLTQALMNLIENALAVQPQDIPIIVRVHRDDGTLNISVLDNGKGFPEGFNTSNIGKFANYKNKKKRGFGLGLAIAAAVARKHAAALDISAREEGGSCVTLRFSTDMIAVAE